MTTDLAIGEIVSAPRLTFKPGAFALVTVTGSGFEVSGAAFDREAAEAWVAAKPEIRRYSDVLVFAITGKEGGLS